MTEVMDDNLQVKLFLTLFGILIIKLEMYWHSLLFMTNGKEEDQTSHGWHTRIYCGQKIYNSIHTCRSSPNSFFSFYNMLFYEAMWTMGPLFKIIFPATNIHYEGDGFEIRINCPMRGLSFSRSFWNCFQEFVHA